MTVTASSASSATAVPYQRFSALDLLRGIAVLGILAVNIWAFAMPYEAYENPAAYGDLTGANFIAWLLPAVFAQEKFITIFSVLFGAGLALFAEHAHARQAPGRALHFRRLFVLLGFGLIHGYLFWYGDILVVYAICGMLIYPLLSHPQAKLLWIALTLLGLQALLFASIGSSLHHAQPVDLIEAQKNWLPTTEQINDSLAGFRAGWIEQIDFRWQETLDAEIATLFFYGPRLLGQMLLGVVLYRSGILTGQRAPTFYWRVGIVGVVGGLTLVAIGITRLVGSQFAFEQSMIMGNHWNSIGSLVLAAGYAGLIIAWSQRANAGWLRRALTATGRMAFSNYLLTTVLCTLLFNGHGFALFGQVERVTLLGLTFAIWAVLVVFSTRWLQRFGQGPLESVWRRLSYGKNLPVTSPAALLTAAQQANASRIS